MEALKTVRHYVNTAQKISRTHQHIAFNQRCRRYQLLQRSLTIKPLVPTPQGRRIAQRASYQFLSARVQQCYSKLKNLEMDMFFQKCQLNHTLGTQKAAAIEKHKDDTQSKVSTQTKERNKKKFDVLLTRKTSTQGLDNSHVVYLSSKQLESAHVSALTKGLNFAPAPVRIPTAHIVANIEAAIGQAKPSEKLAAKARMNVIGAIRQAKIPPRNISHKEMCALNDIANDEKILVLPADKGKATVVMDKADYDDKMQQMLSDEGTYKLLDKDPTASLERRMNSQLLDLRKAGRLHPDAYSRLRSSAARVPLLYGLPKVHKPGVPFDPLCRPFSSPLYELSKFLAGLLSPIVGLTRSHVMNSRAFVEFMRSQSIPKEEILVSFDVVSLFTCIPTDLAIQVAHWKLESDASLPERTSLSVNDITVPQSHSHQPVPCL